MPLFASANFTFPSARAANVVPSNVAMTTTAAVLLTANTTTRMGASIYNSSASDLYLDYNATVSAADCALAVPPNGYFEIPFNPDATLYGALASGTGTAMVREFTE